MGNAYNAGHGDLCVTDATTGMDTVYHEDGRITVAPTPTLARLDRDYYRSHTKTEYFRKIKAQLLDKDRFGTSFYERNPDAFKDEVRNLQNYSGELTETMQAALAAMYESVQAGYIRFKAQLASAWLEAHPTPEAFLHTLDWDVQRYFRVYPKDLPIVYDQEQRKRLAAVQQWTDVQSANQHAI